MTRARVGSVKTTIEILDRIKKFLKEQGVDGLFSEEQCADIEKRLLANCQKSPQDLGFWLDGAARIFEERRAAVNHYENVRRQEREVRFYELNPGSFDIHKAAQSMQPMMPSHNPATKHLWHGRGDGHGDHTTSSTFSFIGGTRSEKDAIKTHTTPRYFTSKPDSSWRNILMDLRVECLDEMDVSAKKMQIFLDEGRDTITEEERLGVVRRRSVAAHRASNVVESGLDKVLRLTNWAGRGFISKSRAEEDGRWRKLVDMRQDLTSQIMMKLGPDAKNGAAWLRALQEVQKRLNHSGAYTDEGILGQAQFDALADMVAKTITTEEAANKEAAEKIMQEIKTMNEEMFKGTKEIVNDEDNMRKYRLLQVLLLCSPFSAALAFMNPLSTLLGPMFDASLSFGQGVGSILTSPVWGPLGDFMEVIHADEALSYLADNLPIVSDVGEVFDYITDSEIMQNLGGAVLPGVIGSPITYGLIAGLFSLKRFDTEAKHHTKSETLMKKYMGTQSLFPFLESQPGEMRKKFQALQEQLAGQPVQKAIEGYVKREMAGLAIAKQHTALSEFLAHATPEELRIFDGLKFPTAGRTTTFSEMLREEGQITPSSAFELLRSNEKMRAAATNIFMAYRSADFDMHKFEAVRGNVAAVAEKEKTKFNQDFIIDLAENYYKLENSEITDRAKKSDFYLRRLTEIRVKKYYDMEQRYAPTVEPSPSPSPASAVPVTMPTRARL